MLRLTAFFRLLKITFREWRQRRPELIGAAIAFYILFSLGPLLYIMVHAAALVFGKAAAQSQLIHEIEIFAGADPAGVVRSILSRSEVHPANRLTAIVSIPMLVFGSAMVFYQLKNALNYIWGVGDCGGESVWRAVRHYLSSFFMVAFAGLILTLLVMKSIALSVLDAFLAENMPFPPLLFPALDFIVTMIVITFLFAMVYKILTEPRIRWSDEWIGAAVTSALITVSQFFIGKYFSSVRIATTYGAIGSFTILMVWIYWSSLVFLLGAMFTKVYATEYGSFHELNK